MPRLRNLYDDFMASFSKRVKMLDEIASSEEMPLIQLPALGRRGNNGDALL